MPRLLYRFGSPILIAGCLLAGCQDKPKQTPSVNTVHAQGPVLNASLSSDGRYALIAPGNLPMSLWDTQQNLQLYSWQNSKDNQNGVVATGFSPDGNYAATAESKNVALWDVKSGNVLAYWLVQNPITSIAVSNQGHYVFMGFATGQAEYVEMVNGLSTRSFEHAKTIRSLALSPDERYAITGSDDNSAILWNLQTAQMIKTWKFERPVIQVLISANSQYVFAATDDGKTHVWIRETGKPLKNKLNSKGIISAVAFSPSEKYLAISTVPKKITVWDLATGKIVQTFDVPMKGDNSQQTIRALAFSENEQRMLTEDSEGHGFQFPLTLKTKHTAI